MRSSTLNWVTFCIETSNKAVVLKLHKDYVPIFMEVSSSLRLFSLESHKLPDSVCIYNYVMVDL